MRKWTAPGFMEVLCGLRCTMGLSAAIPKLSVTKRQLCKKVRLKRALGCSEPGHQPRNIWSNCVVISYATCICAKRKSLRHMLANSLLMVSFWAGETQESFVKVVIFWESGAWRHVRRASSLSWAGAGMVLFPILLPFPHLNPYLSPGTLPWHKRRSRWRQKARGQFMESPKRALERIHPNTTQIYPNNMSPILWTP